MKRRFIILANDYPPNNGGIARLCYEIKKTLRTKGHEVIVLAKNMGSPDLELDYNVQRFDKSRLFFELSVLKFLVLHSTKKDVLISDTFHPCGLLALILRRKTIILAHGAELFTSRSFLKKQIWDRYRSWILKKTRLVISNSKYTMSLVKSCCKESNVIAIPLAVDELKFQPSNKTHQTVNGKLRLCSISRLEKFKGHDFIIETIAELPEYYKNRISFSIAGKGSYANELKIKISDLKLGKIVQLLGFIDDEKLCNFYTSSDVYILCTREDSINNHVEGFGLVFLEAQACGIPVIGTNTGGIPDAIENENGGWLIDADDKEQLSKLLIYLIDNPEVIRLNGEKARKRVLEGCTWSHYYNDFIREIND